MKLTTQIFSNLSEQQIAFTADTNAIHTDSTIAGKYVSLPDGNILLKVTGSVHVKSNLSREDILGHFNFPFKIEDCNIPAYADSPSEISLVVFNIRNGSELTIRSLMTSGRWIGFLGVVYAKIK